MTKRRKRREGRKAKEPAKTNIAAPARA